jgi:hypothetical protein
MGHSKGAELNCNIYLVFARKHSPAPDGAKKWVSDHPRGGTQLINMK